MTQEAGMVIAHSGSDLPPGWAVCNGAAHTSQDLYNQIGSWNVPDLTDKFIRGAGATPLRTVGGAKSLTITTSMMPAHTHGGSTVDGGGAHNHSGSAISNNRSMSHTHSGTTGGENYNHTHSSPAVTSGTVTAWHVHNILVNDGGGTGDGGNYVDTNPSADGSGRPNVGVTNGQTVVHVHASVAVNTGGVSHNHAHPVTVAAKNIDHTHTFTSSGPNVGHTHTINPVGSATPFNLTPVHYALTFIICL